VSPGSARRTRTSGCQQRAPGIDDLEPDRITAIEGSAERANTEREVDAVRTRSGDAGPTLRGCVWRRSG
jgi:hypothetical protein